MLISFNNPYLEKIFENKAVTGKPKYPADVIVKFKKTILKLQYAENIKEIKKFKGLNFEALKGEWKGYFSVRVDIQYRLLFRIEDDRSITVTGVIIIEALSKHYE
jgi:proteic killer suppression protein